jgi:transcription factor TGA
MMSAGSQGQHDQQEIIRLQQHQHHEMNISFGMSPHHHQQQHQHAAPPSSSSSSSMHAAAASFMCGSQLN